jgi:hypothetical protein
MGYAADFIFKVQYDNNTDTWVEAARHSSGVTLCSGYPCNTVQAQSRTGLHFNENGVNRVVFGLTNGKIAILNPFDDSPTQTQGRQFTAGVGAVLSVAKSTSGASNWLYVGTNAGLVTQWDMNTNRINNIQIFNPTLAAFNVRAMVVDNLNKVLFFTGDDSSGFITLVRVNLGAASDLPIFDTAQAQSTGVFGLRFRVLVLPPYRF